MDNLSDYIIESYVHSPEPGVEPSPALSPLAGNEHVLENEFALDDFPILPEPDNQEQSDPVTALIIKSKAITTDAQISGEVIETALRDQDISAIQSEIEDLKRYENDYNQVFLEIVTKYRSAVNIEELEEAKKKFLMFVKRYKARGFAAQSTIGDATSNSSNRLKFQKIEIPEFTGKKEEWLPFKRLFETYVHNDKLIKPIEKHHYLSGRVKGEAASLIDALPLDGSHYHAAWEILVNHYDDPMKRVSKLLDEFHSFPASQRQNLRKLVTHFRAQATALRIVFQQHPEVDIFSQFCIHAFLSKASSGTRLDWEREIEKRQNFASFDEFIRYMEGRCNAFERALGNVGSGKSYSDSQPRGNVLFGAASTSTNFGNKKKRGCFQCSDSSHFLHQCEQFLKLSPEQRNQFVKKKRPCPRCFRGNCDARRCRFRCAEYETNGANIPRNISTRHKAEEVPEIRAPIGNVTTPLGKEALLACTVDHMNIARYKVGWLKKEDQTILTLHDKVITQNLRISVLHDNSSNTWQLRIKHVKESDRGCYVCQINTSIMKSQFGCIDVHVPPDFLYQETSTDFAVREGENVSLVCKATGHPPPRITWRRAAEDGEDILFREGREFKKVEYHRGTTLNFSAVSREQMGAYLCIASNDVPPAVSKRITLSVNFPPSIHVPNQLLGAPLNTEVKMECVVQAYPNAVNYWNKNGTIIFEGSKYRLTEKRDKIYRVISVLRIQNFSKGDEGAYKCESTNSVGSAEGAIRVYELNEGSQTHSQTSSRGDGSHNSRDGRNCVSLTQPTAFVTICLLLSNLLSYRTR